MTDLTVEPEQKVVPQHNVMLLCRKHCIVFGVMHIKPIKMLERGRSGTMIVVSPRSERRVNGGNERSVACTGCSLHSHPCGLLKIELNRRSFRVTLLLFPYPLGTFFRIKCRVCLLFMMNEVELQAGLMEQVISPSPGTLRPSDQIKQAAPLIETFGATSADGGV